MSARLEADPISTRDGYAGRALWYDEPGNQLIDFEQPVVQEIVTALPLGVAREAADGRAARGRAKRTDTAL